MDKSCFKEDVIKGLQSKQKYLLAKYFYDKKGDELFEKIMRSNDYYLTRCELEIFKKQRSFIADIVLGNHKKVDIVAFGPGDFSKTIYLIRELMARSAIGKCFPIDISEHVISVLKTKFVEEFPEIEYHGFVGDYLEKLPEVLKVSQNPRIVFFVGASIGNFLPDQTREFCKKLKMNLNSGDKVLIGFDLKKDPRKVLAAYDDSEGWTAKFNINLLSRINDELGADFQLDEFGHYATYDPLSGACRSFLISEREQTVTIGTQKFRFQEGETIYMEVSQKFELAQIREIALASGFIQVATFMDAKKYFADVIWSRP